MGSVGASAPFDDLVGALWKAPDDIIVGILLQLAVGPLSLPTLSKSRRITLVAQ